MPDLRPTNGENLDSIWPIMVQSQCLFALRRCVRNVWKLRFHLIDRFVTRERPEDNTSLSQEEAATRKVQVNSTDHASVADQEL